MALSNKADWARFISRYRTQAQKDTKTKQQKEAADRRRWAYLPTYTPDVENPDVLVAHYAGVEHRIPNTRNQLPFTLPPMDIDR